MPLFQPILPPFLTGSISPEVLLSPGLPPTEIFPPATPFSVQVSVTLTGSFVAMIGGSLLVRVRIEPIGPDPSAVSGPVTIPLPVVSGVANMVTIPFAAGLPEGAYILVAVVTYQTV